jgi:hypothetical protein
MDAREDSLVPETRQELTCPLDLAYGSNVAWSKLAEQERPAVVQAAHACGPS